MMVHMAEGIVCSGGQNPTTDDGLAYLKKVKEMFRGKKEKYEEFLEVMRDFKCQRLDTAGVVKRVKEIFDGHRDLILGFNNFLPEGSEIKLSPIEFQYAMSFVNRIKGRFEHQEHVYKKFLEILNMYRKENKSVPRVKEEVAMLFKDHPDLMEEFKFFLPENSSNPFLMSSGKSPMHRDERISMINSIRHAPGDEEGSFSFHTGRNSNFVSPHLDQERNWKPSGREKGKVEDWNRRDRDCKIALKSVYVQEYIFTEKVKGWLHPDSYKEFLKSLHLYSQEIIDKGELDKLIGNLLGKYPDLMNGFHEFLAHCRSIDQFLSIILNDRQLTTPLVLEERDRDREKEKKREKIDKCFLSSLKGKGEKYGWDKPIVELDLSNCKRCTPSYRLLPKGHPMPLKNHRTPLGSSVLNDHLVSVTSGSEDYPFKHMLKNQYEESLFKCEDDRYELDMLLESAKSTIRHGQDLLELNEGDSGILKSPIHLEQYFSAINLRCIERLYGEHGLDVLDVLHRNAAVALPVILERLKQKEEEWSTCQIVFSKYWAEVYAKNYHKSLDHRSFYFKQQDKKNISTKALLSELKEVNGKKWTEDDILLAISAGNRWQTVPDPDMEFTYNCLEVHEDMYQIIKYSCGEVSSSDQLDKILKFWRTFIEPVFSIHPQHLGAEEKDMKAKFNADGKTNPEQTHTSRLMLVNGGTVFGNRFPVNDCTARRVDYIETSTQPGKVEGSSILVNEVIVEASSTEKVLDGISFDGNVERRHNKANLTIASALIGMPGKNEQGDITMVKPQVHYESAVLEGVDCVRSVASSNCVCNGLGSKNCKLADGSFSHCKVEREEGELSSSVDSEEDDLGALQDVIMDTSEHDHSDQQCQIQPAEVDPSYGEEAGEDDAGVDDEGEESAPRSTEDSENVSLAGEDVFGSESGDDKECSQEGNEEQGDMEHSDVDKNAECEREAQRLTGAQNSDGNCSSNFSEHSIHNAKPLAKHGSPHKEYKNSRIFYGNDSFYVLFRLCQILYERLLSAKINSSTVEKRITSRETKSAEPYSIFLTALRSLLDGSFDNSEYEDTCRAIAGTQSYVLFTLDKLIRCIVKQLQAIASDEVDVKLIQLFSYEKLRRHGKFADTFYHENACMLLRDDRIYRFECCSNPTKLSIQLMDYRHGKPDIAAISLDHSFADYLNTSLLSNIQDEDIDGVFLRRSKGKFISNIANSDVLDGTLVINGLQCKISCKTSKVSYVLHTEDYFCRSKKRKRCTSSDHGDEAYLQKTYAAKRVQRFHHFLSRF